jgi:hypothetical protein
MATQLILSAENEVINMRNRRERIVFFIAKVIELLQIDKMYFFSEPFSKLYFYYFEIKRAVKVAIVHPAEFKVFSFQQQMATI